MRFDIITIFPKIFDSYFAESILKRAQKSGLIKIKAQDLRDYADGKHKKVDDTPYGGGAGMLMKVEPIFGALKDMKKAKKSRVILFSAKGKRYTQKDAQRLAKYEQLIMICGRYEGVDERVVKNLVDEEISIGDYVLTGGEIPAMIVVDSVTRLLPGVLGNAQSLEEESFSNFHNSELEIKNSQLEYPQYTKPEEFNGWKVPKVLLSGNHQEIEKWRRNNSKIRK
jgi:tRNA (guanine37-N1)-methyltransferase